MRTTIHCRRMAAGAVAMTAVVVLLAPSAHAAAPGDAGAVAAAATAVPESSEVEKVRAVRAIEVGEATEDWLVLTDKNFVFRVYDRIDPVKYPLTKAEAYRVYRIVVNTPDAPDATAFIRTGIHGFVDRDHIEYARRQEEARLARDARQKAAAFAEIPADTAMLEGNDQNFVYQVWRRSTGPKVKDGAATAWGGDATAWKTFIDTTIYQLHLQDQRDAIEKARQESEARARELAAQLAKKNAAAVLGLVAPEGWLVLTDDNFIRQLLNMPELAQPRHAEIATAANAALRSSDPAAPKAFIDTGIFDADKRDAAREKAAREDADRQLAREIKAKAEASRLRPRLVASAAAALAGTPADVTKFLAETQYTVLEQSLMTTTPGLRGRYVRTDGGDAVTATGTPGTVADAPLGAATWKVVPGLADVNCYSLESAGHVGSYLRQNNFRVQLVASDGSDQFKRDATWCPRPGLGGSDVSLESKALPGRFLRHFEAGIFAADDSGKNVWDNPRVFAADSTWKVTEPDPKITTPISYRWLNDDALRGRIGGPVTAEVYDNGVRFRDYQRGRLYWKAGTDVRMLSGAITPVFEALGRYNVGGTPATLKIDQTVCPDGVGQYLHYNDERTLSIYWSPRTGAHWVLGAIRDAWARRGWEKSDLGYPTSDEYDIRGGRRSDFQGGYITWNASTQEVETWIVRVVPPVTP